ncbi:hypothetical protein ACFE04_018623 [Oxalis oulophora]
MANGKYSRLDNRRSPSSYCSTLTIVVFVALCLVGVWMITSPYIAPAQNIDDPAQQSKTEVKQVPAVNTEDTNAQPFEDNAGDLTEDATKRGIDETTSNSDTKEGQKEISQDKPEDKSEDETNTENGSNTDTQNEESKTNEGDSKSEDGGENDNQVEKKSDGNSGGQEDSGENSGEQKSDNSENETQTTENSGETTDQTEEKLETGDSQSQNQKSNEVFPSGAQSDLLNETITQSGSFSTQATESKKEKEAQLSSKQQTEYTWKLCNVTAGADYIPCLDNWQAIKSLHSTKHYEHRERHCPEDPPTCLVPLPEKGYKRSIEWPKSREKIWYYNVPHTKLAEVKGHQNWVKLTGEYLTFPGGGTQFKHGALHYIDFIQESVPDIAWGKRSRVVLDVGCGVASFGGFLFDRDVLTMSLAPKDEHEAQTQFALERGIPAISAVMGTKRLPYPARVFDVVHCARCRVPWHIEGGKLLLELNRMLRPGGFFVWSATPVYQKIQVDVEIWDAMSKLTKAMCWELISINKDALNGVGVATYRKPMTNECYEQRSQQEPPLCAESDDPNAAWNVPLQACMHKVPVEPLERGSQWPEQWPERVQKSPYWLLTSQVGVYGKPAPEDFTSDYNHWKQVVDKSYLTGLGIDWSKVRNVMDMRAIYGGFAAALKDVNVWVMNVVSIDSADTLPIVYERGLFGIYHDWCESFSTYPRSYDLLHADHLFSKVKKRCKLVTVAAEVDRIVRPEGKLIVRDDTETVNELENMFKSMHWEVRMTYSKDKEALLFVQKTMWRPKEYETVTYAIA